jgi:hypothetical protein
MNHPLVHRLWRIAVTLTPVIAVGLTVLGGRRW